MMKKNLIFLMFFIFLSHCGYSAVYNDNPNSDIKITLLNMSGDKEFNNKIDSKLKRYYNKEADKEFKINLSTNINKQIISKDATGKVIDYILLGSATFKISYNNINETLTFKERLNIKNIDNTFEQKKYEDVVKDNFASSINKKLILKLKKLSDQKNISN